MKSKLRSCAPLVTGGGHCTARRPLHVCRPAGRSVGVLRNADEMAEALTEHLEGALEPEEIEALYQDIGGEQ